MEKTIKTTLLLAAMTGLLVLLGRAVGGRSDEEDNGGVARAVGGMLMLFVAPFAATLIPLAVLRSREYGADDTGADLLGDPLKGVGLSSLFSTQPPIEERIRRLQVRAAQQNGQR